MKTNDCLSGAGRTAATGRAVETAPDQLDRDMLLCRPQIDPSARQARGRFERAISTRANRDREGTSSPPQKAGLSSLEPVAQSGGSRRRSDAAKTGRNRRWLCLESSTQASRDSPSGVCMGSIAAYETCSGKRYRVRYRKPNHAIFALPKIAPVTSNFATPKMCPWRDSNPQPSP